MLHYAHEINKAEQMQNNQPAQALCYSTETLARVERASTARANQSMSSASGHSPDELDVMLRVHVSTQSKYILTFSTGL